MRTKIAIYGTGGFGREVHQMIEYINQQNHVWEFVGYFDEYLIPGTSINGFTVLGGTNELNNIQDNLALVIAIGKPKAVKEVAESIHNKNISFPNLIHPHVQYDQRYNKIGVGNIICYGCYFTCNIEVGSFNIFNTRATLGHDTQIGSYNIFQPNVQISGEVKIGDLNFFGVNSCVLQQKRIGNNNKLGAGSLLLRNIKNDATYFGNPAYEMKL